MRQGTEFISQEKTWREVTRRIKKGRGRLPLSCQLGAERRWLRLERRRVTVSLSLRTPAGTVTAFGLCLIQSEYGHYFFFKQNSFVYLEATLRCSMILFILQYYLDFLSLHTTRSTSDLGTPLLACCPPSHMC